jgi:hypothetical protein
MAEHGPQNPGGRKPDPKIAAADWLLQKDEGARPEKPPVDSSHRSDPSKNIDRVDSPTTYDLAFQGPDIDTAAASPAPSSPGAAAGQAGGRPEPAPEVLVEEVWTRQAEWGPNLLILAGWLFALAIFLYVAMLQDLCGLAFVCLVVGSVVAVVMSYPLIITLERPVRVTPEQAVRDFYGALSHHLPHFRRMWLLLGTSGRTTAYYGSFQGFKAYWRDQLRTLKGNRAGLLTPLVFEVAEYRGDKSGNKSRIEVQFNLKVSIRGRRQAGPIHTLPMRISLVRGPDRMWYLENGTLPKPAQEQEKEPA